MLERIERVIKAHANNLLDKAENPTLVVDQTLRDLRDKLADVKKNAAAVIATERRAKDDLDRCDAEVARLQTAAGNALSAGDEAAARELLVQKATKEKNRAGLQTVYDAAKKNADDIRAAHDKLAGEIRGLEERREVIKAKAVVAETKESIADATAACSVASDLDAFDQMEKKVDRQLYAAEAMMELNEDKGAKTAEALLDKYAEPAADIDAEMAKMKAELGI